MLKSFTKKTYFILLILLLNLISTRVLAQQTGGLLITYPLSGEVIQGVVTITGTSSVEKFQSAELTFSYVQNPTDTWFVISASSYPIQEGLIAVWDTTALNDGMYCLRLRVYLTDGNYLEAFVPNLRVRNYTPTETTNPTDTLENEETVILPTRTSTDVLFPTPTPLSSNPIALSTTDIFSTMVYGGLVVVLGFVVITIYFRLRRR